MEAVSDLTGGCGPAMFPVRGPLPNLPHSASMEPSFETYVRDGWIERDERYRLWPALQRRGVATEFDIVTQDEIARHPYYQEFLAPYGLRLVRPRFGGERRGPMEPVDPALHRAGAVRTAQRAGRTIRAISILPPLTN